MKDHNKTYFQPYLVPGSDVTSRADMSGLALQKIVELSKRLDAEKLLKISSP